MSHHKTNRLAGESSPYLLQHAQNPVDWYPWGEEALAAARNQDKPVLVSIGYSACHWCHVMERESFENSETAALMNSEFINIKIDREERPDLDHIYMDAVQAMTGQGGWPLNVFLTPELKPFYGGTYYPPRPVPGRAAWTDILRGVAQAFREKRADIESQADYLTAHIGKPPSFSGSDETEDPVNAIALALRAQADLTWGGFGAAPKFPQTFSIRFLLRHFYLTGDRESLETACLSLDRMILGGIYDQAAGGFCRYSTDEKWLAPHFEKMLYDNALLVLTLCEAFQLTKRGQYARKVRETLAFVERELLSPDGGFYSALDADSEGVEGKFYTWSYKELSDALGADAPLFCDLYGARSEGNWEHTNILWLRESPESFAERKGIPVLQITDLQERCLSRLLKLRETRVRPGLDDKVLLGWNALMNQAFSAAYAALGDESFLQTARRNVGFIEDRLLYEDEWMHSSKPGAHRAFLDDIAFLARSFVSLHEATGEASFLSKAKAIVFTALDRFEDPGSPLLFYTAAGQQDVVVRKKEVYDGAVPSSNAIMAWLLNYLSIALDRPEWKERAASMLQEMGAAVTRYPGSFGVWAELLCWIRTGAQETALIGPDARLKLQQINRAYLPFRVMQLAEKASPEALPLVGRTVPDTGATWLFLCQHYACRQPVAAVGDFLAMAAEGRFLPQDPH